MMKSYSKRPLIDYSYHNADLLWSKVKLKDSVSMQTKEDRLEEELHNGYRHETLSLSAVMENMTRLYLTRFQKLNKELKSIQLEVEQTEKQKWEAQGSQSELLHHNWELLRKLQQLRQTLERQQNRSHRRPPSPPEMARWRPGKLATPH
ncbi:uncharacterized protein PAF06_009793 [Gastrophryne carolinensis]